MTAVPEDSASRDSRTGFLRDDIEEHAPATVLPLQRRPAPPETWMDKLDQLDAERKEAHRHEDVMRIAGRAEGRHKARERISMLLDPGTFNELETFRRHQASGFGMESRRPYTDGVVTGWGLVNGRKVFVYAHDFRIYGGSLGSAQAAKIHKLMDLAISVRAPLIALNDSGGARIQEGVNGLAGYGGIFLRNVTASGVIPQISVMLGPCAGGAAYSPALTDFVFMVRGTSHMYLTGPNVIKAVTSEVVTHEELGGAQTHAVRSGVATFTHDNEVSCLDDVRYLLSLLPSNHSEPPPWFEPDDDPLRRCDRLLDLVPVDPRLPYDMRDVAAEIVDDHELTELHQDFAPNVICALARIDGHVVGIVGNQPLFQAGAIDIHAAEKAARFVRMCDAFNIPLVTLADVPGFLPGVDQEHNGIIRHGAKLLYAYCEATVPRIQVILRKAYGGAYIVMDSRSIGADLSFAWPTNEVAVMGAEAATDVIFRRELEKSSAPEALRRVLGQRYADELTSPYYSAERGYVDEVIDPRDTRRIVAEGLEMLRTKRIDDRAGRKHGNPPL